MNTKKHLLALSIAATTSYCTATFAQEQFTSASFDFTGSDVTANIDAKQFESLAVEKRINTALYCQSTVSNSGDNLNTTCYEKSGNSALEKAVTQSIAKLRFTPASIDGDNVGVRMNYRVIYQQDDASQTALLIPNLGSLQSSLGVNYIEPQERLDKGWFQAVAAKVANSKAFFSHQGKVIRAKTTVTENGKSNSPATIDKGMQGAAIKQALSKAEFIPGSIEGKAVDMPYLAVINQ